MKFLVVCKARGSYLNQCGFSFVELVTVMILVGILTVTILPRFIGKSDVAEYALRDQMISSFRYAQQRAMYDQGGDCYQLYIDNNGLGPQRNNNFLDPIGEVSLTGDYQDLSIASATSIFFDGLGNTYTTDCGVDPVDSANPITMTINPLGVGIEIFSTGFIRKL
jgi:MSHA pilin protein MshC